MSEIKTSANMSHGRQSNIELLRIISMVFIVFFHFSVNGNFGFSASTVTINRFWTQILYSFGRIGVNVFVLISGYFLVTANKLKVNKVIRMWLQLITYSVLIFLIFVIFGMAPFSLKGAVKSFLPIGFRQWWFASAYFVLYLIFPFLNKLLTSLDKTSYQKLLVLAAVLWSVLPTLTNRKYESSSLVWFAFLYALAGYFKLHSNTSAISSKKCLIASSTIYAATLLSVLIADFVGKRYPVFGNHATYLFSFTRVPCVLISLFLFLGFINLKVKQSKAINTIASSAFGIYLIHENPYMRTLIWEKIFKTSAWAGSKLFILYSILSVAVVFSVCSVIELLRINYLEKLYFKPIERASAFFEEKIAKLFSLKLFTK